MSTAVAVGTAVMDIGMMGTAVGATCVLVVGAAAVTGAVVAGLAMRQALDERQLDNLLQRMSEEEISTTVLDREGFRKHKIHERLAQAKVASQFEGADVIMETAKGEILGFTQGVDGAYTLSAKYGADGISEWTGTNEEIQQKLTQQYAYMKVKKEVEKRGYAVVEEEILEDNSIRVHVRRWG